MTSRTRWCARGTSARSSNAVILRVALSWQRLWTSPRQYSTDKGLFVQTRFWPFKLLLDKATGDALRPRSEPGRSPPNEATCR